MRALISLPCAIDRGVDKVDDKADDAGDAIELKK